MPDKVTVKRREPISDENLCKNLIGAVVQDAYIKDGTLRLVCSRNGETFKVKAKLSFLEHGELVYSNGTRRPL